jgi:precorrin-6A/cobalt-precorrin-6A reductase
MRHILILGGTVEARQLAGRLADRADLAVTLSLAGRTAQPAAQPVPVRIGGFGGADGLADYLTVQHVDVLIDATHPYAATISHHAADAAAQTGTKVLALRRPPWTMTAGDRWIDVDDVDGALRALGDTPRRVFLAIGRKDIAAFTEAPQHRYVVRSVDPIEPPLAVSDVTYLVARGPFPESDERALLQKHRTDFVVSKNSGGAATYGKIVAARSLGLAVVMLRPPAVPPGPSVESVHDAVHRLDNAPAPFTDPGV